MDQRKYARVAQVTVKLRAKFLKHRNYQKLEEAIGLLEATRRAELERDLPQEAYGVALVGNPGSGKSTALSHLFRTHPTLNLLRPDVVQADVASFLVPSPSTLKMVGLSCLTGLGYPLRRDRTAGIIWELVQHHLQQRQTLLLHLDEAQDLMRSRSSSEMTAVVNTLKSLMQHKEWPVGLVLSGLPDLKQLLNNDTQLGRRFEPIEFSQISYETDAGNVAKIIGQYGKEAGLEVADEMLGRDVVQRLIYAGSSELGIVIQLIIEALREALLSGSTGLETDHFIAAFARRSGCVDDLNPFVREDFTEIDPRLLLTTNEDLVTADTVWSGLK